MNQGNSFWCEWMIQENNFVRIQFIPTKLAAILILASSTSFNLLKSSILKADDVEPSSRESHDRHRRTLLQLTLSCFAFI